MRIKVGFRPQTSKIEMNNILSSIDFELHVVNAKRHYVALTTTQEHALVLIKNKKVAFIEEDFNYHNF